MPRPTSALSSRRPGRRAPAVLAAACLLLLADPAAAQPTTPAPSASPASEPSRSGLAPSARPSTPDPAAKPGVAPAPKFSPDRPDVGRATSTAAKPGLQAATAPAPAAPPRAEAGKSPVSKDSPPVAKDSPPVPVVSSTRSAGVRAPADLFELPPSRRMDAYGPRPEGVPRLSRAQIVEFGLQNPLIRAADAQVEQLDAVLLKARFAWVPVIKTTTALAPGFQTRCDDVTLPASDTIGTTTPIDFQFCRPPGGVDIDTVRGYFQQLAGAGVTVRFNADFVVPLYTFGKIKNGKAMARAGVALAQLGRERARQETILRVYQAHTALLLARASVGILQEAWSVLKDAKKTIEKDLGEGDDADPDATNVDRDPADLIRVELGELQLQERMNAARKIEAVALATLWTIAGDAAPPGFDVSERDLEPDGVAGGLKPVDHYRELGLQARPEAKMAAGLVDLRKAGEKFARSAFLPDLGVVASAQIAYSNKADRDMRALYYQDRFNYSRLVLALALNWTLDFHNQAFNLKKARAERREAEAQREAANLLLALEVERAYRDLLEAEQAMLLTASAIRKSKQLVIDQQLKQTVGGGNFTDLERALTRWAEWRFKHFESIHAQNVALATLSRTVGVSLQDPGSAATPAGTASANQPTP